MAVVIAVPDYNDSFSRVILEDTEYLLRFTWNESAKFWNFGVYSIDESPVATSMKILPNCPLSIWHMNSQMPPGEFGVISDLDQIGRNDFINGKAQFVYIPYADLNLED